MSMPEDGPGKDGERAMAKVNFKRLRQGASVPANTITDPRDLFNALPEKVSGLDYLRGPQDQVLAAWHDRRDERDLVIKMNTGGGKTLVGLLAMALSTNVPIGKVLKVPEAAIGAASAVVLVQLKNTAF